MKKTILTTAIILSMGLCAFAQHDGGGLLGMGANDYEPQVSKSVVLPSGGTRGEGGISLPGSHGSSSDADGAPLGSGIALLAGLGAAYLVGKRKREE